MSDWPYEDLQLLRKLVTDGLSASQIGKKMGRTRNAVIGKIMRQKGQIGHLARSSGGTASKVSRKQTPLTTRPYRKPQPPKPAPVFERPQVYVPCANLPATLPVAFLDAVNGKKCLHYVGDAFSLDGPDMPVCGAERSADAGTVPYCRRHLASATRAVPA
jgi:GcrA cell cycle regulator